MVLIHILYAYTATVCLNATYRNPNQTFVTSVCYLLWSFEIKKEICPAWLYLFICYGLCSLKFIAWLLKGDPSKTALETPIDTGVVVHPNGNINFQSFFQIRGPVLEG